MSRRGPSGPCPSAACAEPVEVFELVGATAARTRLQVAVTRGLTRLVGRQAELGLLRQAVEQARDGHGQVVALVGEAGVGKSRLAWEITRSHRTGDWLVLESSAAAHGGERAGCPLIELLRGYFRIDDGDDAGQSARSSSAGCSRSTSLCAPRSPPSRRCWRSRSRTRHGTRLDTATRQQRTVEAVKALLFRESQVQPLLLVFEDLHWTDDATQVLLDSLVESLPAARVLLLVNYRPEYRHGWGSKTYYTPAPAGPFAARDGRGNARHPHGRRPGPGSAETDSDRADAGQPVLPGGDGPEPRRERGPHRCRAGEYLAGSSADGHPDPGHGAGRARREDRPAPGRGQARAAARLGHRPDRAIAAAPGHRRGSRA